MNHYTAVDVLSSRNYFPNKDQFPYETLATLPYENSRVNNENVRVVSENIRLINYENARVLTAHSLAGRYFRSLVGNCGPNQTENSSEP